MKIKPTIEIAKRTIQERVKEFNKKYDLPISRSEIVKLQKKYESQYKKERGQAYLDLFHQYCLLDVILSTVKTLKINVIDKLQLTEEEEELCAKALYETWIS